MFSKLWLEVTPWTFVPLKFWLICRQDTAGGCKCRFFYACHMHLNNFQLLQSAVKVSRITSEKFNVAQDKLGARFEQLQWSVACIVVLTVCCQTFTWELFESNFANIYEGKHRWCRPYLGRKIILCNTLLWAPGSILMAPDIFYLTKTLSRVTRGHQCGQIQNYCMLR